MDCVCVFVCSVNVITIYQVFIVCPIELGAAKLPMSSPQNSPPTDNPVDCLPNL